MNSKEKSILTIYLLGIILLITRKRQLTALLMKDNGARKQRMCNSIESLNQRPITLAILYSQAREWRLSV